MTGLDPKKKDINWEFMAEMGTIMSRSNMDGLGYTAVDPKGNIFGERWLVNHEAFDIRETHTEKQVKSSKLIKLKKLLGDFVDLEDESDKVPIKKYGYFGTLTDQIVACTLHTRMATNTVCFDNVHPFVDLEKSISLVHNGVIRNHKKIDEVRSTCDSERILNQYIANEMDKNPSNIQGLIDSLKGYFACGIFAKDENDKRVLDIFRTRAQLGAVFIKELDTVVYSTDIDDVKNVCKRMGLTIVSKSKAIKEDMFIRLDALTGQPIKTIKYRDTTLNESYTNNSYGSGGYTGEESWYEANERWKKEQDEKRRKAEQTVNNNVVSLPVKTESQVSNQEVKLTEKEKQEEAELLRAGFTIEEIEESRKRLNPTKEEINTAKEIINKNDPLNESIAALDGYQFDKPMGLWKKRSNKLN